MFISVDLHRTKQNRVTFMALFVSFCESFFWRDCRGYLNSRENILLSRSLPWSFFCTWGAKISVFTPTQCHILLALYCYIRRNALIGLMIYQINCATQRKKNGSFGGQL